MSRLSVNVNDETADALRALAARHGTTVTEQVRRAVSVYKFFRDQQGQDIQLRSRRGVTKVVLP